MRRNVWNWLRELNWWAVAAVALILGAVVLAIILPSYPLAAVAGSAAVVAALFSLRS